MPIEINIPGSKSISNRALILAYLTGKKTKIQNIADCDDSKYMLKGLKKLNSKSPIKIYTGNAGTTTRFLTALATLTEKEITIDGDKRMRERPIAPLIDALNQLGAKIEAENGCPPVTISPSIPKGGKINLPGTISSQYLSAILMIAPFFKEETITNIEQELCSKPYVKMTIEMMKQFGISIMNKKYEQFKIEPQNGKSIKNYIIESDASSASYIGAFAALNPKKKIFLKNIHKNSLQGDIKFLDYLKKMGCKITETAEGTEIQGPKTVKSLGEIDMNETPDLVMTFAVLAMFTKGKTLIKNIANLRIKECDRLMALENEIKKFGIKAKTGKDWIEIEGNSELKKDQKISIKTYNDHRIAMCFGILTPNFPNLKIENPNCVSKSYTTFWKDIEKLKVKTENIVLIGLRGSGKTKLGKILSEKLGWDLIDIDKEIEKTEKMKISEIVKKHGWEYFRKKEKEITKKVSKLEKTIIATGGGTILNKDNAKFLKENSKIIYLHRKPEDCLEWIKDDKTRPALTNKASKLEELKQLYKERHKIYQENSDLIIKRTENLEKDSKKIISFIELKAKK
jgi:3-phosphoshikimate 1-carboxyvinyltransferase